MKGPMMGEPTLADGLIATAEAMARVEQKKLRDRFAGQALIGIMASESDDVIYTAEGVASRAYAIADAMLAERMKG